MTFPLRFPEFARPLLLRAAGLAAVAVALGFAGATSWAVTLAAAAFAFVIGYGLAARRAASTIAALERSAERDPLTGVYNRGAAVRLAAAELALGRRSDRRLVVAFVDIDHFKQLNDRFGHETGDRALVEVARRLCARTRRSDIVSRFGGEEFVILLRDTDLFAAVDYAERTRRLVADTPVRAAGREIPVSVSIGLASFEGDREFETLLRRADRALYAAKAAGRNRTAVARADGSVQIVPSHPPHALPPTEPAATEDRSAPWRPEPRPVRTCVRSSGRERGAVRLVRRSGQAASTRSDEADGGSSS